VFEEEPAPRGTNERRRSAPCAAVVLMSSVV
jgi:hypothetical protein